MDAHAELIELIHDYSSQTGRNPDVIRVPPKFYKRLAKETSYVIREGEYGGGMEMNGIMIKEDPNVKGPRCERGNQNR